MASCRWNVAGDKGWWRSTALVRVLASMPPPRLLARMRSCITLLLHDCSLVSRCVRVFCWPKLWRMPDGETPSTLSIHYRFHHPKQVHVLLAKAEADAWWKKLFNSIYLLQISPVPNQVHVLLAKAEADAWWETLLPPSQSTTTAPSRAGARAAGEGAGGRLVEEADGGRRGARLLRAAQRGSQCR